VFVADVRAEAVRSLVASAGVIDCDPFGALHSVFSSS
jgi:hypothetical protein